MNMVFCGENCRYQVDGVCTRESLTVENSRGASDCCYFEQR